MEAALPRPSARCLSREEAADYLGIGLTLFDGLRIPPVRIGRRCVYDRVDLDAWLDEFKRRSREREELQCPVQQASIDVATPDIGGSQRRYRVDDEYAEVLGLKTKGKPKRSSLD
jgi:hypothetical protein